MVAMMRFLPSLAEFERLAEHGNTIPVYCQLLGDHLTPVTAFAAISAGAGHAFLLESVVGGEKIARYSFLGANPSMTFEAAGEQVIFDKGSGRMRETSRDPLAKLAEHLASYRAVHLPELPRFAGGAVGY